MNEEDKTKVDNFNRLVKSHGKSDTALMLKNIKKYAEDGHFKRDYYPEDIEKANYLNELSSRPDNCVDIGLPGLKDTLGLMDYKTVMEFVAYTVKTKNLPSAKRYAENGDIYETHRRLMSIEHHSHNISDYNKLVQEIKNNAYDKNSDLYIYEAEEIAKDITSYNDLNKLIEVIKKSVKVQKMAIPPLDKSEESTKIVGSVCQRILSKDLKSALTKTEVNIDFLAKTGKHSCVDEETQKQFEKYKKAIKIISEGGSIDAPAEQKRGFLDKLFGIPVKKQ